MKKSCEYQIFAVFLTLYYNKWLKFSDSCVSYSGLLFSWRIFTGKLMRSKIYDDNVHEVAEQITFLGYFSHFGVTLRYGSTLKIIFEINSWKIKKKATTTVVEWHCDGHVIGCRGQITFYSVSI